MRPLLKLFVAFCLVSFALSRPFPEGDEGDAEGGEEPKEEGDGEESEDAAGDDAGGEEEGGEDNGEGEGEEDGAEQEQGDDAGGEDPSSEGGKGEGKDDRAGTYNQVVGLLDKDTKVDNIESEYLRSALNNDLQSALRNPVVDAIGTIGDYSKIAGCFKSMGNDVKKIVDQEIKSFKACKSKKDSSEYKCSEESSNKAKDKFAQITSKITSCVSSKGH